MMWRPAPAPFRAAPPLPAVLRAAIESVPVAWRPLARDLAARELRAAREHLARSPDLLPEDARPEEAEEYAAEAAAAAVTYRLRPAALAGLAPADYAGGRRAGCRLPRPVFARPVDGPVRR